MSGIRSFRIIVPLIVAGILILLFLMWGYPAFFRDVEPAADAQSEKPAVEKKSGAGKSADPKTQSNPQAPDVSEQGGAKNCPQSKNLPPLKPGQQAVELGTIKWKRDLDQALAESRKTGKPVMLLFDEVPGCSGCVKYGQTVLANPIIRDAAENLFIPVFINNRGDKTATQADKKAIRRFSEKNWDYPVIRFVNADAKDIVPRKQDLSKTACATVISRMKQALEKQKRDIPGYLKSAALQADAELGNLETATFGMYCFWSGERRLGRIKGVVFTRMGFIKKTGGANEVVLVGFDPRKISRENLYKQALSSKGANRVIVKPANSADKKLAKQIFGKNVVATNNPFKYEKSQYSLRKARPGFYLLPQSETQAMLMNSYCKDYQKIYSLLSPSQKQLQVQMLMLIDRDKKVVLKKLGAFLKKCKLNRYDFAQQARYQNALKAQLKTITADLDKANSVKSK